MRNLRVGVAAVLACAYGAAYAGGWEYQTSKDEMTGKEARYAIVESANQLSLKFPYAGQQHAQLSVRQHPKHGTDVILSIKKGQMLCSSYACDVAVKFDDKPPVNFGGTGPADHSSTMIFLRNASKFIAEARKAKKILVQANFFQNGAPVLEFDTAAPLLWK